MRHTMLKLSDEEYEALRELASKEADSLRIKPNLQGYLRRLLLDAIKREEGGK